MTTANPHDRIVTPDTDPDRWDEEEAALFRAGKCSETVEFGNGRGIIYCGDPSKPGASFGHCDRHDASMLVDHYPDGTPRRDANPRYHERPDYQARLETAFQAHQRWCTDKTCECRVD